MFSKTYSAAFNLLLISLLAWTSIVVADIPGIITFQGKVTDSGGSPIPDGSYVMRFRIYTSITGGTLLWDSTAQSTQVSNGVFSVLLGESPQPAINLAFDQDYWLEVTFQGDVQSPRQRLCSTGYAFMSSGLVAGTEVSGAVTSGTVAAIKGVNTATTGTNYGIHGHSFSNSGRGVVGAASASSGYTYGVYGLSYSTSGSGICGSATATTGLTYGVYGVSSSTSGAGVHGLATSSEGENYGVWGWTPSTSGKGIYGLATAAAGYAYGVLGKSNSAHGRGVCGEATALTGATTGVYGIANSPDGCGVRAVGYGSGSIGLSATGGPGGYAADFEGNVLIRSRDSGLVIMELGEGLDYAEGFDVSLQRELDAGTVLIIDSHAPGKLTESASPYDTRVAGIIAGGKDLGSAVRIGPSNLDYDVALAGRVYCNVDAMEKGVSPGDLLTTSSLPGYAMKATDQVRAQGAILGKAMEALDQGQRGQILVLVTLQ